MAASIGRLTSEWRGLPRHCLTQTRNVTAEGRIVSAMNDAPGKDLQSTIGLAGPIMPWWKSYQVTMVANEIA